jgi:hypothetical protein
LVDENHIFGRVNQSVIKGPDFDGDRRYHAAVAVAKSALSGPSVTHSINQ